MPKVTEHAQGQVCAFSLSQGCYEDHRKQWITILKVKVAQLCPTLQAHGYSPWNSPGQNTGVGSLSLLQGTFLTQGLNPGLPHCRQIPYQLSHKGNHFLKCCSKHVKSIFHSIVIKGKESNFEMDSPWIRLHELSEMKSIASGGTSWWSSG